MVKERERERGIEKEREIERVVSLHPSSLETSDCRNAYDLERSHMCRERSKESCMHWRADTCDCFGM